MALGRQRDRQAEMLVTWSELPRSPGHVFYDRLQAILIAAGFDSFVEEPCAMSGRSACIRSAQAVFAVCLVASLLASLT
jgi:hypothetical protein